MEELNIEQISSYSSFRPCVLQQIGSDAGWLGSEHPVVVGFEGSAWTIPHWTSD